MAVHQISSRQLRAARALLNWSRGDLVEHSGISELTIHRFENDLNRPGQGTINALYSVFNQHGIEFTDNDGVKVKPQGVEILVGQEGLQKFFNYVYEHARQYGGRIVQLGVDENLFWAMGVDFSKAHRKRMADLVATRKDIEVHAIVCEGDINFVASEYNHYRWISKELFAPVPFYIYGDNLAIMDFQTIPAPTVILHKFAAIAQAYRKQFDVFWKMAKEPQKRQRRA